MPLEAVGAPLRGLDLLRVDIHAGHFEPERPHQMDGRSTIAAADVEEALTGPGIDQTHELFRVLRDTPTVPRAVHEQLLEPPHFHAARQRTALPVVPPSTTAGKSSSRPGLPVPAPCDKMLPWLLAERSIRDSPRFERRSRMCWTI